ncbi:hypothetical protein LIER_21046 [Lithospermum erythrorhizon]|uniref:CTLH domain-containing protein n=1 Tax=Lithospermum erythrorhizon TaxID=34254 RepID=A0AAV3QNV2_LITER
MDGDPDNISVDEKDIHNVVLSYLVHSCYKETVTSFVSCIGINQSVDQLHHMDNRKRIYDSAVNGDALTAIDLTEQLAPDLLQKNKDLHFELLSLQFVELICSRKSEEALEFARSKLTPFGVLDKYVQKIQDFLALLAYEEPEKSPMFHLLSLEYREHVADNLNRAILGCTDLPSYSALERLIQQTTVVQQQLNKEFGKDAHPPFSLKEFLKG